MTTRGKIVLTILLLGVVGFGVYRWWDKIAPKGRGEHISLNVDELWKRIDAVGSDLDLRTSTASPTIRVAKMTVAGAG